MGSLSKLLPYTCYEIGHTWDPSCARSIFEIFVIGFVQSLKIYAVVYFVSTLLSKKKLTKDEVKKILKQYMQSVLFLSTNAYGYIGFFCVFRRLFRHVNILNASYLPGFFGSLMAILIERSSRRQMNAIYVTNVASECIWNQIVYRGWIKPIPRGEVLVFAAALSVLGYFYHSTQSFSPVIASLFKLLWGKDESGFNISKRQNMEPNIIERAPPHLSMVERIKRWLISKHSTCPHKKNCLEYSSTGFLKGALQGFSFQFLYRLMLSLPKVARNPLLVKKILLQKDNFAAGAGLALFISIYKSVCCLGRHISDKSEPYHGGIGGALAGLSMYFYSSPSVAIYVLWKTIESLCEKGCEEGLLPRIPGSIEFLYALSTGYLFHMAVVETHNMKPSYWRFLLRLTGQKMAAYNHPLIDVFGMESSTLFKDQWPNYDHNFLTESFKKTFAQELAAGKRL